MNDSVFWGVCVTVGQSGGLYIVGGGRTAVKAVEHCGAAHSGAAAERIKHTVLSQRSCSSVKPLTEEGALAARRGANGAAQRVCETIEKNE